MAEPLGKREILAWTVAGVMAVVAGIMYSRRSADPTPAPVVSPAATGVLPAAAPNTVFVQRDTSVKFTGVPPAGRPPAPSPAGEIAAPLTKRESYDTAWIRIGTRQYHATVTVNGESRGEIGPARWLHVRAGESRISVNAPNCVAWDTTVTLAAGARTTLGMRLPRC